MRPVITLLAAACLLAGVPGVAQATLVYTKGSDLLAAGVWSARDDGSAAKRLATGVNPRISPDGRLVAYQYLGGAAPQLRLVPAVGGRVATLLEPLAGVTTPAWSPDSRRIAAVTGSATGTHRLVLIDVAAHKARAVASGEFYGVSFSPSGGAIVYSRATSETYPPRSSLWVAPVRRGKPVRITTGAPDINPLWGPHAVVFTRQRKPVRQFDSWKQDLFLIGPAGGSLRRLTHLDPPFLLAGLVPVSWSADGKRLLGQFGGEDTTYAQTVDLATGVARTVGSESESLEGAALSRDGSTVLATRGAFQDPNQTAVVTVPYGGGKETVLVNQAYGPDWNR